MPPEVNSANCPHCKGTRWVYKTDGELLVPIRCECLERKLLHDFLGPEISRAKHIPKSELYQPQATETGEIEGDRTEENLFLKGPWDTVCQHLRWVLAGKRLYSSGFSFRIVSDADLLDIWLGNRSYKQRSIEVRNDIDTYNALNDVLADITLLIVRLGVRKTPNRAAASVLQEALGIRKFLFKPTWIAEDTPYFGPGHHAYSEDVGAYVHENFDVVDLGRDAKTTDALKALTDTAKQEIDEVFEEGSVGMGVEVESPQFDYKPPETKEVFKPRPSYGNTRGAYKPGRRGNRGGSDGLPEI